MRRTIFFATVACVAAGAAAHHSPNVHYDRSAPAEITGVIESVAWRNPHTELIVTASDESGTEASWVVDARGATQFLRMGLGPEIFQVGEPIRIAGFRGRRNRTALFSTNILLSDGRELVSDNFAEPLWAADRAVMLVSGEAQIASNTSSAVNAEGIFRVWSRDRSNHGIGGTGRSLWLDAYPLTESARAVQASWDRVADNPYIRCETGMPAIMDLGTPIEFVDEGDTIVLYLEEQDTVRRIHMAGDDTSDRGTPLGHSVGRWEGRTLVVTTTDVDWPWFDQSGVPQSEAVGFVERFTLSDDERVLSYELVVTDPGTFTEPVTLERHWVWVPGEEVKPYNCTWDRGDL